MIEIKKSKFYGYAFKVKSLEEVEAHLEELWKEHKKARHICYAYKFFDNELKVKAFDDGEPSGTAGKPILNIIEKKELNNIVIFVVRYFGGIKLGAGGLLRAYSKCAIEAVENI